MFHDCLGRSGNLGGISGCSQSSGAEASAHEDPRFQFVFASTCLSFVVSPGGSIVDCHEPVNSWLPRASDGQSRKRSRWRWCKATARATRMCSQTFWTWPSTSSTALARPSRPLLENRLAFSAEGNLAERYPSASCSRSIVGEDCRGHLADTKQTAGCYEDLACGLQ